MDHAASQDTVGKPAGGLLEGSLLLGHRLEDLLAFLEVILDRVHRLLFWPKLGLFAHASKPAAPDGLFVYLWGGDKI
jgi:hypothetical protein